jgi:N-acetyl-gamma-glutamyl-phosphate reductase
MADRPRIGIIGASGYVGGELIRLLAPASCVELAYLASDTFAGKPVSAAFPGIRLPTPAFSPYSPEEAVRRCDLLFLAQGNGEAMKQAAFLIEAGLKLIDLSADFRLRDPGAYTQWYKFEHGDKALLSGAVYGLPEHYRQEIASARLVANPGCYVTASILALAPLLKAGAIDPASIVVDAKSGVSGAGRSRVTVDYLFTEINESVRAYSVAGTHRHTPEIEQELSAAAGSNVTITFTPHLIPMNRGLLATCYGRLAKQGCSLSDVFDLYVESYRHEPFVYVLPLGEQPSTKATLGTNQCHIGLALDSRTGRVLVTSALDNLVKGAAGQAVQNMNLMLGLPETHALEVQGLWP